MRIKEFIIKIFEFLKILINNVTLVIKRHPLILVLIIFVVYIINYSTTALNEIAKIVSDENLYDFLKFSLSTKLTLYTSGVITFMIFIIKFETPEEDKKLLKEFKELKIFNNKNSKKENRKKHKAKI